MAELYWLCVGLASGVGITLNVQRIIREHRAWKERLRASERKLVAMTARHDQEEAEEREMIRRFMRGEP